ncbi:DUF5659 domain-containing protein [Dethiothermospora halolimnae]|uniref:DUF5659 domain-containing protein n=1 Tax=Dethiothermospora halolimnae TaxID=3114390 RepID=UPI003CCBBA3E
MNLEVITDKDLIVFLVAKGFKIKRVRKDRRGNRSLLYFEKSRQLEKAILDFVNKTEMININEYQAAERRVKTLLSMQKTNR